MGQDHLQTAATRNVPIHIPVSLQRITTAVRSNLKLAYASGSRPLRFNKDAHHSFLAHAIAYRRSHVKDSTLTKKIQLVLLNPPRHYTEHIYAIDDLIMRGELMVYGFSAIYLAYLPLVSTKFN